MLLPCIFTVMGYNIEIHLSADAGDALTASMPNWKTVRDKAIISPRFGKDDIINIAHATTKHRLEAARMYLSILKAGYQAKPIHSVSFMIRSMADNIFFSLSSALDALSFEINQVYEFSIKVEKVQIDHHRRFQKNEGDCVRCKLDGIGNDNLAAFLNSELPIAPIPQNHWYGTFSKYRHQVIHRLLYLIHLTTEGRYLPDDPSVTDPIVRPYYDPVQHTIVIPNYTANREMRDYCEYCFNKVLSIVEMTYSYLELKI